MATKKTTKKAEETKKTAVKAEPEKAAKNAAPVKKEAAKKPAKKAATEAKKAEKKVEKKAEKATKSAAKTAKKAAEKALVPAAVKGLFFEYGEKQVDAAALADMAKAAFKENGGKGAIRSIELYVKAEDNALYYVINGKESGKVEL